METRSKRSHITPKATTGRVGVTEDDKRFLFEPLTRYGFLPTKHLIAIDRRHHTTTRSRLKKYFQETEKWPLRNKPIIRHTDALRYSINAQAHYYRGPATFRDLNTPLQLQKWIEATTIGPRFNDHDVLLSCSIADIEIATKKAGLRFISHLEILKGASEKAQKAENPFEIPVGPIAWNFKSGRRTIAKTTLIPDAIFGIEYPEGIRFYAAEFDRGNETYIPTHSSRRHVLAAQDALLSGDQADHQRVSRHSKAVRACRNANSAQGEEPPCSDSEGLPVRDRHVRSRSCQRDRRVLPHFGSRRLLLHDGLAAREQPIDQPLTRIGAQCSDVPDQTFLVLSVSRIFC